jgi:hypothetical protein
VASPFRKSDFDTHTKKMSPPLHLRAANDSIVLCSYVALKKNVPSIRWRGPWRRIR